ncbi:MAG: hypothetical protein IT438_01570 [Phycisphaerales bacterium]|nr:hypothetical protein [Phycisphaerales bacterium]
MRLNSPMNTRQPHNAEPPAPLGRGNRRASLRLVLRAERAARAGAARAGDRGTVLLMVLGVLALMAIVAVVYAAIGKGDRVSSASIVRNTRVDDQASQIADYLAGVVRDGLFATYVEPDNRSGAAGPRGTLKWRGWDYPYTDPQMVSQPPTPGASLAQAPRRAPYRFTPTGTYSTPWTIDNSPDPRSPGVPFIASSEPANGRAGLGGAAVPQWDQNNPQYLSKRDWLNISNFAPSGNFVNLANLRNNFRAESGFGTASDGSPRMSEALSVADSTGVLQRVAGARSRNPALTTSDQLFAFRPMYETPPLRPEDPDHINNQWCDTDGDGFADARWFELVDVWNQNDPRPIVPNAGRARLFVAARCVDLSGRINVNTAGDNYRAPEQASINSDAVQFVPGLTPGDVDLLRVLRRSDASISLGECYDLCPQPTATNAAGDYSGYGDEASARGGLAAYQALWDFRDAGRVQPQLLGTQVNRVPDAGAQYLPWTGTAPLAPPTAWDRFRFYSRFGASTDGVSVRRPSGTPNNSTGSREVVSTFDTGDLLDLLTFEGINDYGQRSRLESTTVGRSNFANTPPMLGYDPLRSNRPREIEMKGRTSGSLAADLDKALLQREIDVRRLLTTISGDRPLAAGVTPESALGNDPTDPRNNLRADATGIIEALAIPGDNAGIRALRNAAAASMFSVYLDSLMPYTDSTLFPNAWEPNPNTPDGKIARGLSYGGRAELAYLMSAHLALNLREAVDRTPASPGATYGPLDQAALPMSLDMNQAAVRETFTGNGNYDDTYPWPRLGTTTLTRLTSNNTQITSTTPAPSTVIRRNIFGIAPQPFMTQVMAINLYCDSPPNAGGDDDVSRNYDANGNPQDPITINFDQSLSNPDFLFSVLAFQITNPFDVDVQIEPQTLDNKSFYYVEYAGRTYRLRQQQPTDPSGFQPDLNDAKWAPKLKPGETRVFYATFPASEAEVETRVNSVRTALSRRLRGGAGNTFRLPTFAQQQFGEAGREPVHIAAVYPETGLAVRSAAALTNIDLHATNTSYEAPAFNGGAAMPTLQTGRAERRVINLWRVVRDETRPDGTAGRDGPTQLNATANDQLIDRIHDPSDPGAFSNGVLITSLVDPFGSGNLNQEINGTRAGDDSVGGAAAEDNTGFSFANFASISRPTNPLTITADSPRVAAGAMPIWCFEAKADNEYLARGAAQGGLRLSLNKPDRALGAGGRGAFVGAGRRAGHEPTLSDLIDLVQGANQARLDPHMQRKAEDKTNNPYDRIDTDRINQLATLYSLGAPDILGARYKDVAPIVHRVAGKTSAGAAPLNAPLSSGNYEYNSRALFSRVGDFLLPLAVGPSFDPFAVGTDDNAPNISATIDPRIRNLEARWTTLAESLALAADYYTPTDPTSPFYRFARDTRKYNTAAGFVHTLPKADHGCLTLDAWAPYIEKNDNAQYDPGVDQQLGNGIPLALNLLDRLRVGGMPAWYGRQAYAEVGQSAPGGVNRLIPGRININTAPEAVLRALSLLSPELLADTLANGWLAQTIVRSDPTKLLAATVDPTTGAIMPAMLWDPTQPLKNWDIAAAIVAYRDKLATRTRAVTPGGQTVEVSFRDDRTVTGRTAPAGTPVGIPWGRGHATDIPGIREARGFKSVGEVMAVQLNYSTDNAVQAASGGAQPIDKDNSITRLGLDGLAIYSPALEASVARNLTNNHFGPNAVVDDYAEKLTIANAILNNITVRSDVFAVWFVINGYTPEDVAVEDGFPMVPSVARRYVMVVDRSNVTDPGMKPRIVMLREVPMR